MDKKWISDEQGHSLFELSLSLPIMILLTLSIGTLFLWTMKFFVYEMADWALQEEMCSAIERIAGDARAASRVRIRHKQYSFDPLAYCDILLWKPRCFPTAEENRSYYLAEQPKSTGGLYWKLYHNSDYEPITGDSIVGNTNLLKFHCEIIPPARLRIELKGRSLITRHNLEVKTELFLPELMKNGDTTSNSSGMQGF